MAITAIRGPVADTFSPPAKIDDFTTVKQREGWSKLVSQWFDRSVLGTNPNETYYDRGTGSYFRTINDGPRTQFFVPTHSHPLHKPLTSQRD